METRANDVHNSSMLLSLPDEVLVHVLRLVDLRDMSSGAGACRRLHNLGIEHIRFVLVRHVARDNACFDCCLSRVVQTKTKCHIRATVLPSLRTTIVTNLLASPVLHESLTAPRWWVLWYTMLT